LDESGFLRGSNSGLPDFSWCNIPKLGKIYQITKKYTKCKKVFEMAGNRLNVQKICQHLPLHGPPKITQIWIFGLKIYYLATLDGSVSAETFFHLVNFIYFCNLRK
jgi:hypothetical protein